MIFMSKFDNKQVIFSRRECCPVLPYIVKCGFLGYKEKLHGAFDKNYHFIAQGFHHLTRSCFPQPSEQYVWERQTIVLEKVSFS